MRPELRRERMGGHAEVIGVVERVWTLVWGILSALPWAMVLGPQGRFVHFRRFGEGAA